MGSVVHHEELCKFIFSKGGGAFKPATPFEKLLSATMFCEGISGYDVFSFLLCILEVGKIWASNVEEG